MTIERLDDHPDFASWSVAEGRWKSLTQLQLLLSQVCGVFTHKRENKEDSQLLQKFLGLGLLSYLNQDVTATTPSENIVNMSHGKSKILSLKTAIREMNQREDLMSSIPPLQFNPQVAVLKKFPGPDRPVEYQPIEEQQKKEAFSGSMEMGATVPWPKAERDQDSEQEDNCSMPKSSRASEKPKVPVSWTVEVNAGAKGEAEESVPSKQPPQNLIKRLSAGTNQSQDASQNAERRSSTPTSIRKQDAVRNSYGKKWTEEKEYYAQQESKPQQVEPQPPSQRSHQHRPSSAHSIQSQQAVSDPLRVEHDPLKARPPSSNRPPSTSRSSPEKGSRPTTQQNGGGFSGSSYTKHLIFQINVPLRCAMEIVSPNRTGGSSADITHLAIGSNAKNIQVIKFKKSDLHTSNKQMADTEIFDSKADIQIEHQLENVHKGSVYAMDWHANSELLASGSNDKAIRISRRV